ncbi:uncharacterized protein LOC141840284 [Curcuma longa]|uniref:uncharacterized protein LOC141840284 n=1 Tax=Curcuma longa TaxID=136217 RepID=UPI003D9DE6E6
MEEILSAHRKCLGRSIAKKKPVKVVYISNPMAMRVTASAATFHALVQKLTGRDSDVDAIASAASVAEPLSALSRPSDGTTGSTTTSMSVDPCNSLVAPSEVFGGGFDAQILENFWRFFTGAGGRPPPGAPTVAPPLAMPRGQKKYMINKPY